MKEPSTSNKPKRCSDCGKAEADEPHGVLLGGFCHACAAARITKALGGKPLTEGQAELLARLQTGGLDSRPMTKEVLVKLLRGLREEKGEQIQ